MATKVGEQIFSNYPSFPYYEFVSKETAVRYQWGSETLKKFK